LKQKDVRDGLSERLLMTNNYYDRDKHGYMQYSDDLLADYIYSLIAADSFLNYDTAIEFGAGIGNTRCRVRFRQKHGIIYQAAIQGDRD